MYQIDTIIYRYLVRSLLNIVMSMKGLNREHCVQLLDGICAPFISRIVICFFLSCRQPLPSRPDLVGDSGFGKPGSYLSSSLPDVSSVNYKCSPTSANMGAEDSKFGLHDSKEYMSSQENITELIEAPQTELLDGADLDWELDACMEVSGQEDCNKNEDLGPLDARILAPPVMFAESIGQRVKRARGQIRTAPGDASTTSDFNEFVRKPSQDDFLDSYTGDAVRINKEQLEFVGDWPSESLEQRGHWSRQSTSQTVKNPNEKMSNFEESTTKSDSTSVEHFNSETPIRQRPHKTEFQKLLDLLQGDDNQTTDESTQDVLPLGGDRHHSNLVTSAQPVLPDCVLDWMSERSSDPGKGSSHTPSPIKELGASQDQSSTRDKKEACTNVHTPANGVKGLESGSEQKDQPNRNADLSLSSGGEVECSSASSQERRKVSSRRAGKSCKLALTFTHQSPLSCPHAGSPVMSLQQSELNPSPELHFTRCSSALTQTEPQDFALLWRIDQEKLSGSESDSCTRGVVFLEGNPLRFVPKINKEKSSEQQVIPYRVCHEKGSQVEENDLRDLPFKHHSLEILSRHFKHVPKETLEDLYEKCHQDMEWTTNLLLDSGEHLCRDDEENVFDDQNAEGCDLVQGGNEESCDCQVTGESFDPKINYVRDTVLEETGSNCGENPAIPNNTSWSMSNVDRVPEDGNDQNLEPLEQQPEEPDQREILECLPGPSIVIYPADPAEENETLKDHLQTELGSEGSQTEVFEKYLDGALKDEVEEGRETKEEINAIMLSLLEEMERKKEEQRKEREKDKRSQRKNGPMNIQTLELKLTTELALQLTELFGPVGISPGN